MMGFLRKEINIDRKIIILFVIANFLIMGLYYSYSIFIIKQLKDDVSEIKVKTNIINMTSDNLTDNQITINANTSSDITINLANASTVNRYYRIMHEGVPTGVLVYEKNGDSTSYGVLNASSNVTSVLTINNTTDENVTINFLLQESNVEQFDKEIGTSYVNVSANFDHSGAHAPSIPSNMIPVYYVPGANATTEGTWHKADINNSNSDYIWYDYDNFMWANAVTVTDTNRDTYLNAEAGTEIVKDDINAFFVWIPKYKYYIVSADGNASYERIINVNFLNRNDVSSIGTVSCVESISTKENPHLYSEICTDSVYGEVQNNLSTYTHPAFDENDTGFWMGKFANKNSVNFKITNGTNASSLSNAISNSYARQMLLNGNDYGFAQNSNASYDTNTWLYTNGNELLDAHTITSMEWGAVAILTSSSYGKSANPMYYTDTIKSFTRVYNNTSNGYTGRSTYYTTSSTSVETTSTNTIHYYNLTDVTHTTNNVAYPIGTLGPGASTTGTIYGVYDMAGGNYTTVLGIVMKEDGSVPSNMNRVDKRFYTSYSYMPYTGTINSTDKSSYLEIFRLGDGIKEHVRTYNEKGMWQDGELVLSNYGIMIRGGYRKAGSLFSTEISLSYSCYDTFTVLKYNP